ncbi:oligosaccharide flippase family protein, partial [candidate division WWE3 bacterium]|nr:oligosaccharide flippase family protein [candidate division WWE3 bacterium]
MNVSVYKKVGLNTFYQLMGRFVTALVGLLTTRLITSHFGLEGYGEYQTVIAFVTLFWVLTDFGFNAIAVREMAASEDEAKDYYSALISLRVGLGALVMALAWLILLFLPYSALVKNAIVIGAVTIFFQSLMGIGNAAFQLRLKYGFQLLSNTLGSLVSLGMFVYVIFSDQGLIGLAVAFTSGSIVMGLVNLYLAKRLIRARLLVNNKVRYLLKETLPFGLVLLLSLLTTKIDAILLSVLNLNTITNESAVGIYNLSYKL